MSEQLIITPQPVRAPKPDSAGGVTFRRQGTSADFGRILDDQLHQSGVRFSKHAVDRMESRGIRFDADQVARLQDAVDRAGGKGARESLVLLEDTALVVSIRNNTVVTVMDGEHLKNNVFTNIDSAVIA